MLLDKFCVYPYIHVHAFRSSYTHYILSSYMYVSVWFMVFNATFNNISVISYMHVYIDIIGIILCQCILLYIYVVLVIRIHLLIFICFGESKLSVTYVDFYTRIFLLLQICMVDLEVFVPFVDIGGIDAHHYLNFVLFCWYWWNWCPSLFKLSLHDSLSFRKKGLFEIPNTDLPKT